MTKSQGVCFSLRLIMGVVLSYSGVEKLLAYDWWREVVTKMDIFSIDWVGPLSGMLPGLEIIVGLSLVLGFWLRAAALFSALLFALFGVVNSWLIIQDVPAICGCFGPEDTYTVSVTHAMVSFVVSGIALGVMRWSGTALTLDSIFSKSRETSDHSSKAGVASR